MAKPVKPDDFVHLHTHSDQSQLDGCGKIDKYVHAAALRGNRAISFTDHGTMRGYQQLRKACEGVDVKPIYGIEFYVSPDMRRKGLSAQEKADIVSGLRKVDHGKAIQEHEEMLGIRDRWHITAWAENNEGLRNLFRLSSSAFIDGFYYKPRIDLKELQKYSEGVMISTGCMSSPINDCWVQGKKKQALEFSDALHETFGDRYWLEIQPHAIREQTDVNRLALKLRDRYGNANKLLATQDAHYVHQCDAVHHDVLLCIGTGSKYSDEDRFRFTGDEFFMKNRRQMRDTFKRNHDFIPSRYLKEALDSTLELADRCTASVGVDYRAALLPPVDMPGKYDGDTFKYLKDLCVDGWVWREMSSRAAAVAKREGVCKNVVGKRYRQRLTHELGELQRLKFVPYFLIIHDLYRWARGQNIMVGPGRGSVGGSLVAYLLGITAVDPIEHGLIFERFINPFRVDMPDCDMDFEDARRREVIDYVVKKYGRDKVCQIATVGKLSGKQCLKDVARVFDVPYHEVNEVTSSIIERASGDERANQTIADSFRDFKVCRDFDRKHPEVLEHAQALEGMAKNLGIHAAGVVASPVPLTDLIPLEIRKHEGEDVIVSAGDMHAVAASGLVKLDVLGLRTLTVIRECVDAIEKNHGKRIDLESSSVNLNDPVVLKGFTDHDYVGVFQYDTNSAEEICRGVKFTSFEDVAAMMALNRPGTARSGLAAKYVERKKKPELVKKADLHPKVSEITADTLGIIVYQEHVIKIFTECAGFAPGTADLLRKSIGKKVGGETIDKERKKFVEGCREHSSIDEKTANRIMDAIIHFGSYGFNKSHATEYGVISFWGMWLKMNYPLEFYWALLKNEPKQASIQKIVRDAKTKGIELLPPHVSTSGVDFAIDGDSIRGSLVDIKGVGRAAANAVIEGQPYDSFFDFVRRVDRRRCHVGVITTLATSGALEGFLPSRKWFVENAQDLLKLVSKGSFRELKERWLDAAHEEDWADEEKAFIASKVNPSASGNHPIEAYDGFVGRHVNVPLKALGGDFFEKNNNVGVFTIGVVVDSKLKQIGDFHTGKEPTKEEKKKAFWGRRYANVTVEGSGGDQCRCKFDFDIYDRHQKLIDDSGGAPVIVHAVPNKKYQNMNVNFAIDVERLRQKIKKREELDVWEKIVIGRHPVVERKWKTPAERTKHFGNPEFVREKGGFFTGVVVNVRPKHDKNGNEMAFTGLLAANGDFVSVMAFSSVWAGLKKHVAPGKLISAALTAQKDRFRGGWSYLYSGKVKILKSSTSTGKR